MDEEDQQEEEMSKNLNLFLVAPFIGGLLVILYNNYIIVTSKTTFWLGNGISFGLILTSFITGFLTVLIANALGFALIRLFSKGDKQ